jgi:hypothetical protein
MPQLPSPTYLKLKGDALSDFLENVRSLRYFLIALIASLFAAVLYFQAIRPHEFLMDDSFTYFTMARQAHDAGVLYSYTGLDHATGAHPGYYLLLVALYPIFGLSIPEASIFINATLVLIALIISFRTFGPTVAVTMLFVTLLGPAASAVQNGLESSLLFLSLAMTACVLAQNEDGHFSKKQALVLGLCLGFTIWARLDTIFFPMAVVAIIALHLYTEDRSISNVRRIVITLGYILFPFFVALLGIFALNFHYDGTLLPLSGRLKSSFPIPTKSYLVNEPRLWILKLFIVALGLGALYLYLLLRKRRRIGILIPSLMISCAMLLSYDFLFVSGIGAWYGTLGLFTTALVSGLLLKMFLEDRKIAQTPINGILLCFSTGVICLVILLTHIYRRTPIPDWITPNLPAVAFLAEHARPGERAAELKDGIFAFYSTKVPTYNLTGLGNNKEYANAVKSGKLAEYLKEKQVAYIIGGFDSPIQVRGARVNMSFADPIFDNGVTKIYPIANCKIEGRDTPNETAPSEKER